MVIGPAKIEKIRLISLTTYSSVHNLRICKSVLKNLDLASQYDFYMFDLLGFNWPSAKPGF